MLYSDTLTIVRPPFMGCFQEPGTVRRFLLFIVSVEDSWPLDSIGLDVSWRACSYSNVTVRCRDEGSPLEMKGRRSALNEAFLGCIKQKAL